MRAVRLERFGPPAVLRVDVVPDPVPGHGEVVVATSAVGLNMSDVYRRQGRYAVAGQAPWVLGYEAAGTISAVGAGVRGFTVGDRVAFADVPFANAELVRAPVEHLVPVPDEVSLEVAAAVLLQGLTAQFLSSDSYRAAPGERVLVHAAGSGVGLLLTQMLAARGVQVLAVASTADKRAAALAAGAAGVTGPSDWTDSARSFALNHPPSDDAVAPGVDAVYDSVGTTLPASVEAVRVGGTVVFYGFADGPPPPLDPMDLFARSITVVGGDLWNVLISADARRTRAAALFAAVTSGTLRVPIAARYAFTDAAAAHSALESRTVSGKVLLHP